VKLKTVWIMLLSLNLLGLLSSCAKIKIKNTEVCSVAGFLQDGMICGNTLKPERRVMTFDEMVNFLEPNIDTNKGAALCQSLEDWSSIKTSLEQACELLEDRCTFEMEETIQGLERVMNETSRKQLIDYNLYIPKKFKKKCPSPNFGDCK